MSLAAEGAAIEPLFEEEAGAGAAALAGARAAAAAAAVALPSLSIFAIT